MGPTKKRQEHRSVGDIPYISKSFLFVWRKNSDVGMLKTLNYMVYVTRTSVERKIRRVMNYSQNYETWTHEMHQTITLCSTNWKSVKITSRETLFSLIVQSKPLLIFLYVRSIVIVCHTYMYFCSFCFFVLAGSNLRWIHLDDTFFFILSGLLLILSSCNWKSTWDTTWWSSNRLAY